MKHYLQKLQEQICENWNRKALCNYGGDAMTFGELAASIERLHVLFSMLGISKGDRIALCARNQANWGVAFLAVNTYEAVVVPILPDFHKDAILSILEHSGSVALFADKDIFDRLEVQSISCLKWAVNISDFSDLSAGSDAGRSFEFLDARFNELYPCGYSAACLDYPTDNDKELAVINYTSGSTGQPKGVMLRYECFSANIEFGQKRLPSTPNDNLLSILPMAHMFGMVFELLYPLCGGTTVYFLGRTPSPTLLMKAMADVKPYQVVAVPMIFEKIYRKKLLPAMNRSLVRFMMAVPLLRNAVYMKMRHEINKSFGGKVGTYIMGGAAVNPEVEAFLHRIGLHFTIGYGMTEAAPLLAFEDWSRFSLRSCGKAMDYVQLRIDSENPVSVPGEIQAKGINIMSGYYGNEEATKAAFTEDGWFRTGDLGTMDTCGNLYIKGRSKSMLLSSSGQNIYPEEIECIVNSQEFATESVVVMRDDRLVALVRLDEDELKKCRESRPLSDILEGIRNNANQRLAKFCQLYKVEAVDKPFEKTPKMSIKRYLYS